MDRKLARKNLRFGFSMFILEFALVGAAFIWAAIYLSVVR
jgi:hypothetical protein